MLTAEQLKHVVHFDNRSQRDCVLLILSVGVKKPKDLDTIRSLGRSTGVRHIEDWNLGDILGKARKHAIKAEFGWELSSEGINYVRTLLSGTDLNIVISNAAQSLRTHLKRTKTSNSEAFVEESIVCFEAKQYRAAVVLAWVGAMSVLHQFVFSRKLADFNTEANRRDKTWRAAKSADDLGRMREHDFLDVLEAIGVLGKSVKMTLQNHCLQLRNSCGHPNGLKIAENSVAAHIEKLTLNVFSAF